MRTAKHGGDEKCTKFQSKKLNRRCHSGGMDTDTDGTIMLKWMLKKGGLRVWSRFICFKWSPMAGSCEYGIECLGSVISSWVTINFTRTTLFREIRSIIHLERCVKSVLETFPCTKGKIFMHTALWNHSHVNVGLFIAYYSRPLINKCIIKSHDSSYIVSFM